MAEAAEAVPRVAPPRLRLVWSDPLQGLPFSFDYVARELASTLSVRVAWRPAPSEYRLAPHEILVVLLDSEPPGSLGSGVMGSTTRGLVPKTLWVMLPNVKRTLWRDLASSPSFLPGFSRAQLARAVARVVAHEVLHVVAPAVPHASRGLMRSHLGRAELIRKELRVDSASQRALWEALDADQARADDRGAPARERMSPGRIGSPEF